MRFSDWSSDVCSSDLDPVPAFLGLAHEPRSRGRRKARGVSDSCRNRPPDVRARDLAGDLAADRAGTDQRRRSPRLAALGRRCEAYPFLYLLFRAYLYLFGNVVEGAGSRKGVEG